RDLRELHLDSVPVTDQALEAVAELSHLRALYLGFNDRLTDVGLGALTGLRELCVLSLVRSEVGDAAAKVLGQMPQLRLLYLNQTHVSNAGVKELAALKELRALWLFDTQVTSGGVRMLKEALPQCAIYHRA